jgi:hypothetical protein
MPPLAAPAIPGLKWRSGYGLLRRRLAFERVSRRFNSFDSRN